MTAALVLSLSCDAPHCEREIIGTHADTEPDLMAQCGWEEIDGSHYCSSHAEDRRADRPFGAVPPEPW